MSLGKELYKFSMLFYAILTVPDENIKKYPVESIGVDIGCTLSID